MLRGVCSIERGNDVSTRVQAGAIQGATTRFQAYTFVSEVSCDDERIQGATNQKAPLYHVTREHCQIEIAL